MNSCPISVSLIISGFATQLFFLAAAAQGIPTITRQPVGLSRSLGDKASLRVTATGDEPLSYQWYRNGLPLQDSTNQLLTLTNLTRTNSGRYTVEVSNAAGKVNSEAASVDVDTLFVFVTDTPISKNSSTSGGSVAWRDFDGDGRIDLLVSGTTAPLLFHNDGDGRFTRILAPNLVVSRTYGVDNGFAMWVDYDNDGRPDIYIVTGESPIDEPDYLFRNLGDGRFEPVVNAMTKRFVSSMSASWGDFNGDGRLDVFLGNVTSSLQARPSELWFGQADGAFRQASDQEFPGLSRQNFGSTVLDFDLDGKVDVIVATNPGGLPIAYKNQGGSGFDPITLSGGGGFIGTVASGDYDNDGLPDLFVTYAEKVCRLYHNDGDGQFSIVTGQPVSEEPGRSTGANWGDYDNDGWLDLFLPRNTFYTSNGSNDDSLWHNNGDGTFTRIQAGSVGADGLNSWAAAWGDYNNDGFLDLVVACESANRLYRNGGNTNAWLMLKLIGTASNRDAIGARIRVRSAVGSVGDPRRVQHRQVTFESGYAGQNDSRVHFGLADATRADEIEITWPSGQITTLTNVAARQILTIIEPSDHVRLYPGAITLGAGPRQIELSLSGPKNLKIAIEQSSDLQAWTETARVTLGPDGAGLVSVPMESLRSGFFRAKTL